MSWKLLFTKQAQKDALQLAENNLKNKANALLEVLRNDPFASAPSYEKLVGDLDGVYSRRINIKHRLLYTVNKETKVIKIIRMWSHYE